MLDNIIIIMTSLVAVLMFFVLYKRVKLVRQRNLARSLRWKELSKETDDFFKVIQEIFNESR